MAVARDIQKTDRKVVAVIGDGSMTGGLAFEGLNNAGVAGTDLLVVLNDNRISIDPNVGALHEYLAGISASKGWNSLKTDVWDLFDKLKGKGGGTLQRLASRVEDGLKAALTPGMLFEALGFRYIGPVDGHDVVSLAPAAPGPPRPARPAPAPHADGQGQGVRAGRGPTRSSGTPSRARSTKSPARAWPRPPPAARAPPKWQDVFGDAVVELAELDERVVGVTAAMPSGTSLGTMMAAMPERAFDVGIAEMHAGRVRGRARDPGDAPVRGHLLDVLTAGLRRRGPRRGAPELARRVLP